MHGPLPASPPSMSPSTTVGETHAPACKRLKTSHNEFEYDDQTPVLPVDELVTFMSLKILPEIPKSKRNLLHWWQVNEQVVPKLSLAATKLPCVPASS